MASRKGRTQRSAHERGAVAVETALLTAFFLIPLIIGGLEVGRVMWVKSQLTNAAREGGWVAQVTPWKVDCGASDPESVSARAAGALRQGSQLLAVQTDSVTIDVKSLPSGQAITGCTKGSVASGDRLLITVSGPISLYSGLGILPDDLTLVGSQEVRVL